VCTIHNVLFFAAAKVIRENANTNKNTNADLKHKHKRKTQMLTKTTKNAASAIQWFACGICSILIFLPNLLAVD
jgi:hypothetical protein